MPEHHATIHWQTAVPAADFLKGKYSREHTWTFDGGAVVPGSSSPSVVPQWSSAAAVDPEEAFIASISSCHMLTFIWLASKQGFALSSYRDAAVGVMTKGANGVPWVSKVTLHPELAWSGEARPTQEQLAHLHHQAHEQCFISNSVRTEIVVV